ncbi:uncharacterized protein LOC124286538 [Haliotis rubra]|uniref:uncharacterized protein LOC124286538 n=1 Tax=Haliotis rubra TaxID=36100 RepID=UPI001EE58E06|nr:uncharacterized protein LOC124286538 [Haliotis rubra]
MSSTPDIHRVDEEVPSTSSMANALHFWTDKEEEYLVCLRHERNDDFISTRNHSTSWKEIVAELETINCKVTQQQAFNKYSSLKKKWKEIIDAPSGSEVKYFRHKTSFDNMYGNKAGTKPGVTIDTDKDPNASLMKEMDQSSTEKKPKKGGKALKRRSEEMIALMREQHAEMKQELRHQHTEKMTKLDRMLDLYQREVEQTCMVTKNE